jgi:predicted nucleotide-binding protein
VRLSKSWDRTLFPTAVLEDALKLFTEMFGTGTAPGGVVRMIQSTGGTWDFDTFEEFFSEHRQPHLAARLYVTTPPGKPMGELLEVSERTQPARTTVNLEAADKTRILTLANIFERAEDAARLPTPPAPTPPKPRVFIGHGRSPQWRDLKDHLHDLHGYDVEAYESGARAGHAIRDILASMTRISTFAVLVMTAEDEMGDETWRARQNVVHETGLFQGRLGFDRAIVLLEEGVEAYTNLQGIHQIRFAKGNIKETFGEVLATLRREFGDAR